MLLCLGEHVAAARWGPPMCMLVSATCDLQADPGAGSARRSRQVLQLCCVGGRRAVTRREAVGVSSSFSNRAGVHCDVCVLLHGRPALDRIAVFHPKVVSASETVAAARHNWQELSLGVAEGRKTWLEARAATRPFTGSLVRCNSSAPGLCSFRRVCATATCDNTVPCFVTPRPFFPFFFRIFIAHCHAPASRPFHRVSPRPMHHLPWKDASSGAMHVCALARGATHRSC